jgi:hypothetical protein
MLNLIPNDFDWSFYIEFNKDLKKAGIVSEQAAISHFLNYGLNEKRIYKKIKKNTKYKNSSVFICGTSPEIEILNNKDLVKKIEDNFFVLCINTSYHYFNNISCIFFNGRYRELDELNFSNKKIDEIYIPSPNKIKEYKTQNYCIETNTEKYVDSIETDLNKCLPHGPTTLLDIVFPFCAFHEVKNIYLLGAEYIKKSDEYKRHKYDNMYLDRFNFMMDRNLELDFSHKKLNLWKQYFDKNNINCFALSEKSETPFEKLNINNLL